MKKNKLNKKGLYIVVTICLLIIFFLSYPSFFGNFIKLFTPTASYNDFSFSFSQWGEERSNIAPIYRNYEGQITVILTLNIQSNRDDLKYKIYYPGGVYPDSQQGWGYQLNKGDNTVYLSSIVLPNLYDKIVIEVCVNAKAGFEAFDKSSKGTVCKKEYFNSPKIDVEITPSTLSFERKLWESKDSYITVKNTGDIAAYFYLHLPEWLSDNNYYSGYCNLWLNPGASELCEISSLGTNNLKSGTYTDIAYIYSLREDKINATYETAAFKKPFNLQTIITGDGA